jgi:hypothetical protein
LACIKKAFLLEKIPLSNDLWSLIESISTENNNEKILHVFLYLSHAKKFILNGSAQEAALIRLEQKWKKTLDSQQLFFF